MSYKLSLVDYTDLSTGYVGKKPMIVSIDEREKYNIYPRYSEDEARQHAEYIKDNYVLRQHEEYGWYAFVDPRTVSEDL